MKWVEACQNNKLVIYLLALALCCLGLFSIYYMPITPFPESQFGEVRIQFSYLGANADTVQSQVTAKVVDALQSVDNIRQITANSKAGASTILLDLDSDNSQDTLQTEIKIMQAISSANLPAAVSQPTIEVGSGRSSLISFVVTSTKQSLFQIDNFILSTLYPKFSSMPGVILNAPNSVAVVKIQLLPEKMAQYHLDPIEISQRIDDSYKDQPMGALYVHQYKYTLNVSGAIHNLPQFQNLIVGYQGLDSDQPIYLKDIAHIAFEPESPISNYYNNFNGHIADIIALLTTSVANPFQVSKETRAYVKKINQTLPKGTHITPIFDMASVMWASISELMYTILISSCLVLLIALLFLGRFRTTLIPIATIPVCLLGAIFFIGALGDTINILVLLAMVIAVGLVVDDAIVVVENITRYLELGHGKSEAVLLGTQNIALTVVGITLTLLAVYLPIAFCRGPFIFFIKAFAVPLAVAVFISGIAALTLTPVMAILFVSDAPQNPYQKKFTKILHAIIDYYHAVLKAVLRFPWLSLSLIILLIVLGGYAALKIPYRYFPADPNGKITITLLGGNQDTIQTLRDRAQQFRPFYQNQKVMNYSVDIQKDPVTGRLTALLEIKYLENYLHQISQITDQIHAFIHAHHIVNAQVEMNDFSAWSTGADLSFYLYGGSDVKTINQKAEMITKLLKQQTHLFTDVTSTINHPHRQLLFQVDYAKAARFGIFKPQIQKLLSIYYGGYQLLDNFNIQGLSVPILVQFGNANLQDMQSLQTLRIQSPVTQQTYPLNEFISIKPIAKPIIISTFNNQPSVQINANLVKGVSLQEAMAVVNDLIKQKVPTLRMQYTGKAWDYLQSSGETSLIMVLGILCVYFLLAILFKSLRDPLIILLTVPFCVIGGALTLYLVGGTINLFSILGLITLIGLITKHGVLIVQFANQQLKQGDSVYDAVFTATHHRFRPIMMTTLAMTFGALPLVFSTKIMYVARQHLGIVLVGGLLIGTFFSLFVVPLVYVLIKRDVKH